MLNDISVNAEKALMLQGLWIVCRTQKHRRPVITYPVFFFWRGVYYTCTCLKANTKTAGFKTVSKPRPPNIWKTQFRHVQSKAREDLVEDTSTLTGNETGLLAASGHRLVVNKCCTAQLCTPLLLRSVQTVAQDEKTTSHTLIHKAFTPPWAQRRHFLTNKTSMQLFL